ncbi:MAG: hypothetical protein ACRDN9_02555 [Streptosporangiaceae bacterium]
MPSLQHMRFDNVGSLLRPASLKRAYADHDAGSIDDAGLRQAQDEAVASVIAAQEAHGFPVVVDGEFRRRQFMESFATVAGFDGVRRELTASVLAREGPSGGRGRLRRDPALSVGVAATEPLRLRENRPLEEYRFAAARTAIPVKATLVGPDRLAQMFEPRGSIERYRDRRVFLDDVVGVERDIVRGLVDAGCRYIQVDAPGFTAYVDGRSRERMRARGLDPDEQLDATIAAENAVIAGFSEVTFGIHVCRGNREGRWHREGTYDAVAERLFGGLRHDRFLLEYDTPRAGNFAPLRFVQGDAVAVLGLVTTKHPALEDKDEVKRRIDEAAGHVPTERLGLSPQCGFASSLVGNPVTVDDQWRKLDLVRDVCEEVWGR